MFGELGKSGRRLLRCGMILPPKRCRKTKKNRSVGRFVPLAKERAAERPGGGVEQLISSSFVPILLLDEPVDL
jgi:hypothetical protein